MNAFVILGSVFVALAAVIHVLIFFLESVLWSKPSTWRRFGLTTQAEADTVRPMAFNQGFYNLFLAIGVGIGLVLIGAGFHDAGTVLVLFAALSMVLAAVVLITSSPKLARSAAIQGAAPLVGSVLLAIALFG